MGRRSAQKYIEIDLGYEFIACKLFSLGLVAELLPQAAEIDLMPLDWRFGPPKIPSGGGGNVSTKQWKSHGKCELLECLQPSKERKCCQF